MNYFKNKKFHCFIVRIKIRISEITKKPFPLFLKFFQYEEVVDKANEQILLCDIRFLAEIPKKVQLSRFIAVVFIIK